jgi:ribonuclease Y
LSSPERSETVEDLRLQLELKDRHIRELYEEITVAQAKLGEAQARLKASEDRMDRLEGERRRLREQVQDLERERRERRRLSDQQERRVARLEREIERLKSDLAQRDDLMQRRERELEEVAAETDERLERKEVALEDALRRVDGLSKDLEDREAEIVRLRLSIASLQERLEDEHRQRRRLAEPSNRLRAGIELFNASEYVRAVGSISKSLGAPDLHVSLDDGPEELVLLTFVWGDIVWQRYAANPNPEVAEPKVYLAEAGEELPDGERPRSSNAHIDSHGRVSLGL